MNMDLLIMVIVPHITTSQLKVKEMASNTIFFSFSHVLGIIFVKENNIPLLCKT